jgi:hypothetical protein
VQLRSAVVHCDGCSLEQPPKPGAHGVWALRSGAITDFAIPTIAAEDATRPVWLAVGGIII